MSHQAPGAPGDPHAGQPVLLFGLPVEEAGAAAIFLHGRGATAEDILLLAGEIGRSDLAYLAPQAAGFTWYPERFLEPQKRNQPWLDSALALVDRLVQHLKGAGISAEKTILAGFSQGGCLALEYAARHPRRYGGVAGLSAGLIGADFELAGYGVGLQGTPVFLGCDPNDPHIPAERVRKSAEIFQAMGARVTMRLYPGLGHAVHPEEIEALRGMVGGIR